MLVMTEPSSSSEDLWIGWRFLVGISIVIASGQPVSKASHFSRAGAVTTMTHCSSSKLKKRLVWHPIGSLGRNLPLQILKSPLLIRESWLSSKKSTWTLHISIISQDLINSPADMEQPSLKSFRWNLQSPVWSIFSLPTLQRQKL